ncbi:MAG: ABC transporter substrate-binding protein [Thermoanaerobaculia bacterium]|nr:ABC transporter substrate-binding protein [Thermoanaerobaculia bacterium]
MIGTTLAGRYNILGELGRGGMGVVYRARDSVLSRDVAIKTVSLANLSSEQEARFRHEAHLVGQMDHPSIVPIYDFGQDEARGCLFFVMPVVSGSTLRWRLGTQHLALGEILDMAIQTADALAYSHDRGAIHRDIKPENVMMESGGTGGLRVRILDFGLARSQGKGRGVTGAGVIVGTLNYLSPEQVAGEDVDERSDIYSLGVILYECLAAEPPFSGDFHAVMYRILNETPPALRSLGLPVEDELDRLVLRCLEKDAHQRPQRAVELRDQLRFYASRLSDSDRRVQVAVTPRSARPQGPASPFVSRKKEFSELARCLDEAGAGTCQLVLLGGEAGIGKSRLAQELSQLAHARGIRVLTGAFGELESSFPYQGFCDLIQDYFRDSDRRFGRLADIGDLAPELVGLFPVLSEISAIRSAVSAIQSSPGSTPPVPTAPKRPEDRTSIFELLARTLLRLAGGRSLLLILENLHHANVAIEALQYIVRRLANAPVLVVSTYRTEEVDRKHSLAGLLQSFRGDPHFRNVLLRPFSEAPHRQFVEALLLGPVSDGLATRLLETSEGNPYFTRELVRVLVETGGVQKDAAGLWTLSPSAAWRDAALPETIQQVVERRVQKLEHPLREILSMAAVLGRRFDLRDLEALGGRDATGDVIDRLIEAGLLEEEAAGRGKRLAFTSSLVRDVLYLGLPRRKRRTLHRTCAEKLEARHEGRTARVRASLLYHYAEGDVAGKAVEHALLLASEALQAFSLEEAVRAARTALDFLVDVEKEEDASREVDARLFLARAYRALGDLENSLAEADIAVQACGDGKPLLQRKLAALILLAETSFEALRTEDAARYIEQALLLARELGDGEALSRALSLAATVAGLTGEHGKARLFLEEKARLEGTRLESPRLEPERHEPARTPTGPAGDGGGGTLTVALSTPLSVIDPALSLALDEVEVLACCFEPLLTVDDEGHVLPNLAEEIEELEGGSRFVLTLRHGLRFHDGEPLTASSVKAAIERALKLAPASLPPAYSLLSRRADVEPVQVLSESRLEFRLEGPTPNFPALLTDPRTAIVREPAPKGEGSLAGTGPFRLVSPGPGRRVVLQRTGTWWRGPSPFVETLEFRSGMAAEAIASGLKEGSIDVGRDLLPEDLDEVLRDPVLRRRVVETPQKTTYFALFNQNRHPGKIASFRRALSGVVDPQALVWRTIGRFAQPAMGLIPPGILGHDPGRRKPVLSLADATELLQAGGPGSAVELRVAVHPALQDRFRALSSSLFELWESLGITAVVVTATMGEFLRSFSDCGEIDVWIGRWTADYDDPANFTLDLFHSRKGQLKSYFSSPETDAVLVEARRLGKPAAREAAYRKFELDLIEDGVAIPLFHELTYRIAGPNVHGLILASRPPFVNYHQVVKSHDAPLPGARPARRGILHIPITEEVASIDPSLCDTAEAAEVQANITEPLTRVTEGAQVVPWLAREVRAEDGGRFFRIFLREDVRFHDGRRLSARDVRYSFERLARSRRSSASWLLSRVRGIGTLREGHTTELSGVRVVSPHELVVELAEPLTIFPTLLSDPVTGIVPEGSDPSAQSWKAGNVGTGPFRLVHFEATRRVELEANPSYWREGFPCCEGLVFHLGVSPDEIFAGLKDGTFALASDLKPGQVEALRRDSVFGPRLRQRPRLCTYFLAVNVRGGILKDRDLRRRFIGCIDVRRLVERHLGSVAMPASGLIPPGILPRRRSDLAVRPRTPGPFPAFPSPLVANVHPSFDGEYGLLAGELFSMLLSQGIDVVHPKRSIADYMRHHKAGTPDLMLGRWIADYPDPDSFAGILHSRSGGLGHFCGSAELDEVIEQAAAESEPGTRRSLYLRFEETIREEAILLPLFHEQLYRFARPEVRGLELAFTSPNVAYERLSLEV